MQIDLTIFEIKYSNVSEHFNHVSVFSCGNLVFTVSHKNFVLKLERIIQYLFLFGCPFLSRECYLLFHFLKRSCA